MNNEELRNLQIVELNILYNVAQVCEKNGIPYFLMDGTLLGSVRHQGFIPWDDDVDIAIPRPYFQKFLETAEKELLSPFKIKNFEISKGYEKLVTRVVNENIRLYHNSYSGGEQMQPAWIDIFVLDGMPNNSVLFRIHKYRFLLTRPLYHYSCFETGVNLSRTDRTAVQKFFIWLGKTFKVGRSLDTQKLLRKMEKILKKYRYEKSERVVNAYSSYMFRETYQRNWYSDSLKVNFEGYEMMAPSGYKEILTHLYGDYMTPPDNPEIKHNITRIEFGE